MNFIYNLGSLLQHKQTKRLVLVINPYHLNNSLTVKNIRDGVVWNLKPQYQDQYIEIKIPEEFLPKNYSLESFITFNKMDFRKDSPIRQEFRMFIENLKELEFRFILSEPTLAAEGLKLGDMNIEFGKKEED